MLYLNVLFSHADLDVVPTKNDWKTIYQTFSSL